MVECAISTDTPGTVAFTQVRVMSPPVFVAFTDVGAGGVV